MKTNKRILGLCNVLLGLFLLFLFGTLMYFGQLLHPGKEVRAVLRVLLAAVSLMGCSLTLALKDYIQNVLQSAAIDVAGIHNKKALEKKMSQLQDQDDTLDVGILMFDLNDLKKINDNYGHDEGDRFIRTFASFLTRILTENSFLARYGGDEFLIIQEHTRPEELEVMNRKLQALIDEYNLNATHPVSYAVGYEVSYRNHYFLIPDLLKTADARMYEDKAAKKQQQESYRGVRRNNGLMGSISAAALSQKLKALLQQGESGKVYAFIMTDICDFHLINDYWGYETGNEVLQSVLKEMKHLKGTVFAYRFHSDIFVSVVDVTGEDTETFEKKLTSHYGKMTGEVLENYPIEYFSLNTGIYWDLKRETDPERIISHANIARRKAGDEFSGLCVYSEEIENGELQRADVLHSFQKALENEEFLLYFQPKIGPKEQVVSAEVLVRWQRPDGELWTPDRFLPVLEKNGRIGMLDFYVYEKAFQWMKRQRELGKKPISLSLNVSPAHFYDVEGFTKRVLEMIRKYEVDCSCLVFEITESAYIHNIDAVNHMIDTFHEQNIRISMDDFGSGYSSLNTLKEITFDEVKIDKRFLGDGVSENGLTENGKIVLQEIFHLLKRTKKSIVCEGVETLETARFLLDEGCDELQGYYYYRPMPEESFEEVLKES